MSDTPTPADDLARLTAQRPPVAVRALLELVELRRTIDDLEHLLNQPAPVDRGRYPAQYVNAASDIESRAKSVNFLFAHHRNTITNAARKPGRQ